MARRLRDGGVAARSEVPGVSQSAYLGVLGITGLTAWVGIKDIGRPQPCETVVVSAAAGAVGSVAGQIAKLGGARVVGVAGGPEKCALLTDRLGFDAAVDHKAADWRERPRSRRAVRAHLRLQRCRAAAGPRSFGNLLVQRALFRASSCSTTSIASPRRWPSCRAGSPREARRP